MKKLFFLIISIITLLSCTSIEKQAEKQMVKTMKEMAKNPDSFTISKLEVVFKAENDSLIVYSFTGKGQNGFGGYTATNFEYYYQIGKDYKRECVINLEEEKSLEDRAEAIYRPIRVALMEAGKDYLGEIPAEHIKATAELCLGFLGRDIE